MQQKIHAVTHPIRTNITIPGSKGMTLRALMLAALANGVSEISGIHLCEDTRALITALDQLGIATQLDEGARSCIIAGGNGQFPKKEATLWCADAEIIACFLVAASAGTKGSYYLDGTNELRKRSLLPLITILLHQNIQIAPANASTLPLSINGADTLEGANVALTDTSSLMVAALLMIAPFARSSFQFNLADATNTHEIDMTCALMAEFNVLAHRMHQNQIMVPVPQRYLARDYTVEPDFSLGAYYFAAAAVTNGELTIQPAKRLQSKQSDTLFLTLLEKMGCKITDTELGLTVHAPHELQGIDISIGTFSDSFLALLAIAPFAKSATHIKHIGTPDQTEMDRFNAIKCEFTKLNIHYESGDYWIKIFPSKPNPGVVNSHNDYRVAMALAVIGLKTSGTVINQSECVNKVLPDFFASWNKLSESASTPIMI